MNYKKIANKVDKLFFKDKLSKKQAIYFIHIPKNAGTTIEEIGYKKNYLFFARKSRALSRAYFL